MKTKATLILILGLIFSHAQGQNQGAISELYMSGKWNAECALEVIDQAGIRFCGLCSYLKNPADSKSWHEAEIDGNKRKARSNYAALGWASVSHLESAEKVVRLTF